MSKEQQQPNPVASIPLPSADLINYRFDNLEKSQREQRVETKQQFDQLNHKLDTMTQTFITRPEYIGDQKNGEEEHKRLQGEIDGIKTGMKWWAAWVVGAITALTGLGLLIKSLFNH